MIKIINNTSKAKSLVADSDGDSFQSTKKGENCHHAVVFERNDTFILFIYATYH